MLELIPTLLAQQSKQVTPPVQPIETPVQTPAKASTSTSVPPISTPELARSNAIVLSSTPAPSPKSIEIPQTTRPSVGLAKGTAPQVATSPVKLPPVPQSAPLPFINTKSAPSAAQPKQPNVSPQSQTSQAVEQRSNAASLMPQTSQRNSVDSASSPQPESPAKSETPRSTVSTGVVIPAAKPDQPAQKVPSLTPQQQLLEQRLAEIVAKERAARQTQQAQQQIQQQDTLVSRAYSYATQRQFEQARKLLQHSAIPTELRSQVLSNINDLESASRIVGTTSTKAPVASKPIRSAQKISAKKPISAQKPASVKKPTSAQKPTATFTEVPSLAGRSQQTITIQVPPPMTSLPIQRQPIAANKASTEIASNSAGAYIDQLGSSNQLESSRDLQAYNRTLPKLTSRDQLVYPLPNPVAVTSGFGWRRHPVTGVRRFHAGVDLGAGQGTPVIAARGGRVTAADRMGGYGLAIVMEQPDGSQDTLYAHLSQILVRPGQNIQPGTIIGRVGSTGLSTGPHLHYEARRKTNSGWTPVDPGAQLEAARIRLVRSRQLNAQAAPPALQSARLSSSQVSAEQSSSSRGV